MLIRRTLVALALVGLGWAAARAAQAPAVADFEVSVVLTKEGQITIECVRGCGLLFGRRAPERSSAEKRFTYGPCTGPWTTCESGRLHGWVTR
jgi:hypothetical protein